MLTEKDYCDYDTQKSLMELGFPMQAQSYDLGRGLKEYLPKIHLYDAQKWLREEKGIGITIFHSYYQGTRELYYQVEIYNTEHWITTFGEFKDWSLALLEGIKKAIKILKEK